LLELSQATGYQLRVRTADIAVLDDALDLRRAALDPLGLLASGRY
jgi:hypothetical protein